MFVFVSFTLQWDSVADDAQRDKDRLTMAMFVIFKEGDGLQDPPEDTGIVIESMEVLQELIQLPQLVPCF